MKKNIILVSLISLMYINIHSAHLLQTISSNLRSGANRLVNIVKQYPKTAINIATAARISIAYFIKKKINKYQLFENAQSETAHHSTIKKANTIHEQKIN